jgi:RNA polymerase sigma-70 factor (ECF subfamily)
VPADETEDSVASFERFFAASHRQLGALAYAYTGDPEAARDLTQEALTRAWQHWNQVSRHPNPDAWVRTVLHNLATSRWRRRRLERVHANAVGVDALPAPDALHIDLARLICRLPANQRQALVLHDVIGLTVAEVASELAAPEGTVRSWLSRARADLARQLGPAATKDSEAADTPAKEHHA